MTTVTPDNFTSEFYMMLIGILMNIPLYFFLTKKNNKDIIDVKDSLDSLKLEQAKSQAVNETKINQIQHDITNIRALETLTNSVVEKIERSSIAFQVHIENMERRITNLEEKAG